MDQETLKATIKDIKQSFRFYMNGITAQSLRDKGQPFHLIWGISLLHLHEMAADYPKDYDLACTLWNENIRECKILATLLMPEKELTHDTALKWSATLVAQEIADCSAKLFAAQPYAEELADELALSTDNLQVILAFNIYGRLLTNCDTYNDGSMIPRELHNLLGSADKALRNDNVNVRYAAIRALQRYADLDTGYKNLVETLLLAHNLGDWL